MLLSYNKHIQKSNDTIYNSVVTGMFSIPAEEYM